MKFSTGLAAVAAFAATLTSSPALGAVTDEDQAFQAEVCSVLRAPGAPGVTDTDDPDAIQRSRAIDQKYKDGWTPVKLGKKARSKTCAVVRPEVQELYVSPDRLAAVTRGGWQAGPLAGGYGDCIYERVEGQWALVACVVRFVS